MNLAPQPLPGPVSRPPGGSELALGTLTPTRSQCLLSFNKVSAYKKGLFPCAGCFLTLCQEPWVTGLGRSGEGIPVWPPWGALERDSRTSGPCLSFPCSAFSTEPFQQNPSSVHGASPTRSTPPRPARQQSAPTPGPSWLPSSDPSRLSPIPLASVKSASLLSKTVSWFFHLIRSTSTCCLDSFSFIFEKPRRGTPLPPGQVSTRAPPRHTRSQGRDTE